MVIEILKFLKATTDYFEFSYLYIREEKPTMHLDVLDTKLRVSNTSYLLCVEIKHC
jgi:hypothetical protein